MRKSIWKKTANILLCGVIGAAILIAGCGDKKLRLYSLRLRLSNS